MTSAPGTEDALLCGLERVGTRRLGAGEVHLWVIPLDGLDDRIQSFRDSLSVDERARADRLLLVDDRNRFIAARFGLRLILGSYCRMAPSSIRLAYGSNGKPRLAHCCRPHVHFNLSHSADLAVLAVRRGQPVGIDVEHLSRVPSDADNTDGTTFLSHWTRTEALIKALGARLSPLDLATGREAFARWSVRHFAPGDDHVGAVATRGHDWRIVLLRLEY
jgi:4'-phosphopantetheinyl transferase